MKKNLFKGSLIALAAFMAVVVALPALAGYSANLKVTESGGNDYNMLPMVYALDTDYLVSENYITATGFDTRVETSTGTERARMLTDDKLLFAAPVDGNKAANLYFKTGQTADTAYPIIAGYNGYVTTADHADLEPGSDFTITQTGYYDSTAIGAFVYKANAFATYTNGAGSIKSSVLGGTNNILPTGNADPDAAWSNEAHAYDSNPATAATTTANVATNTWSSYLYLTRAAADITGYRIYAALGGFTLADIDIYDGTWHNSTQAIYDNLAWTEFYLPYNIAANITQVRIRFYNGGAPAKAVLYEILERSPTITASAVASGYSSGIHTIQTSGVTAGNLTITIDTVDQDTDPIAAVPGNANDWISMGGAWPYMTEMTFYQGATERFHYEPSAIIVGTALPDETNAYDGVFTWGTNPADLAITMGIFISDGQPVPAAGTAGGTEIDMAGEIQIGLTDVGALTDNPFVDVIDMVSDQTNIPTDVTWIVMASLIVITAMVICFRYVPHQLITVIVGGALTGFFISMGIFPFWVIFIFAVGAAAIILYERMQSVG